MLCKLADKLAQDPNNPEMHYRMYTSPEGAQKMRGQTSTTGGDNLSGSLGEEIPTNVHPGPGPENKPIQQEGGGGSFSSGLKDNLMMMALWSLAPSVISGALKNPLAAAGLGLGGYGLYRALRPKGGPREGSLAGGFGKWLAESFPGLNLQQAPAPAPGSAPQTGAPQTGAPTAPTGDASTKGGPGIFSRMKDFVGKKTRDFGDWVEDVATPNPDVEPPVKGQDFRDQFGTSRAGAGKTVNIDASVTPPKKPKGFPMLGYNKTSSLNTHSYFTCLPNGEPYVKTAGIWCGVQQRAREKVAATGADPSEYYKYFKDLAKEVPLLDMIKMQARPSAARHEAMMDQIRAANRAYAQNAPPRPTNALFPGEAMGQALGSRSSRVRGGLGTGLAGAGALGLLALTNLFPGKPDAREVIEEELVKNNSQF